MLKTIENNTPTRLVITGESSTTQLITIKDRSAFNVYSTKKSRVIKGVDNSGSGVVKNDVVNVNSTKVSTLANFKDLI